MSKKMGKYPCWVCKQWCPESAMRAKVETLFSSEMELWYCPECFEQCFEQNQEPAKKAPNPDNVDNDFKEQP